MGSATAILVPRENVNDQSVTVVAWLVPDGQHVEAGQPVVTLEGSKTTFEVCSPVAGVLHYLRAAGEDVAVGGELARIGDASVEQTNHVAVRPEKPKEAAPPPTPAIVVPAVAVATASEAAVAPGVRFSKEALQLIRQRGLDPAQFAGRGLVRAADVLAPVGESPSPKPTIPAPAATADGPVAAQGVPVRSEKLSRAKPTEAQYLRSAHRHTLPSVISVAVPTRGLRSAAARHPEVQGNVTALVIHEAARLLKKYPALNAFHHDGTAHYYDEAHVGFAVDADRGLKVPVIRQADRKTVPQIVHEMREWVVAYLNDSLPVEALAGGTFTVTDLSGEGVFEFLPLLNQGQSAILGIGGEFFLPGSKVGQFHLILAFDHQLAEGRQAARFLGELRERLEHYEAALRPAGGGESSGQEPRCAECLRTVAALRDLRAHLVQTVAADHSPALVCTICLTS
jgi:2-oxoglutarate dehydrogenase E2 component (dihydrolipoamide succinyltransferase)